MNPRFSRSIEKTLVSTVKSFPVTVVTGPRQSGKTTLLKYLFADFNYLTLESPDLLLRVKEDPRSYFADPKGRWIIDEAQNYPEIFSFIQEMVDRAPEPGRFILLGSQNFLLAEKISQTLAGRAAILELLPLSYNEYITHPKHENMELWKYLYQGAYPRPYQEHLDTYLWYAGYIRTYLERDVRSLLNVKDLAQFQLFLKLCAGRHGQLLNLSALGSDCGISQTTASHWLSILETSYIVFRLRPYHRNFSKRLVKTPKLYFYDSAIVCMLLGIESPEHLKMHASRGAIFEGYVLSEIIKQYFAKGKTCPLFFWRDHLGVEIDGLIEKGEELVALEIKSSATYTPDLLSSLKRWQVIANISKPKSYLVYGGDSAFKQNEIVVLPWNGFQDEITWRLS